MRRAAVPLLMLAELTTCAPRVICDPVPGFLEPFSDGTTRGFSSGNALSNPGTGGASGAGDGYLEISNSVTFHLGAYNARSDYAGDYETAGVDRVRFKVNDVGADDPIELHLLIGNALNLWSNVIPCPGGHGTWETYTIPLADSTQWVQVKGDGSFRSALQTTDRLHWRHDLAPFESMPDSVAGEIGIDDIELLAPAIGAAGDPPEPPPWMEAAPNPAREEVRLTFTLAAQGRARLEVFDLAGRLVRTLASGCFPAGERTVRWALDAEDGRPVPRGLYLCRLRAPDTNRTGKILVID